MLFVFVLIASLFLTIFIFFIHFVVIVVELAFAPVRSMDADVVVRLLLVDLLMLFAVLVA